MRALCATRLAKTRDQQSCWTVNATRVQFVDAVRVMLVAIVRHQLDVTALRSMGVCMLVGECQNRTPGSSSREPKELCKSITCPKRPSPHPYGMSSEILQTITACARRCMRSTAWASSSQCVLPTPAMRALPPEALTEMTRSKCASGCLLSLLEWADRQRTRVPESSKCCTLGSTQVFQVNVSLNSSERV